MASIIKFRDGWRAQIRKQGIKKTKSFQTKAQAQAWATSIEAQIITGRLTKSIAISQNKTIGDMLDKYSEEVSIKKRGSKWEQLRIELLRKCEIKIDNASLIIGNVMLSDFDERHVAAWRDTRSKDISGSSINREWNIFSNAFKIAIKEWKWIEHNPWHEVKRPEKNLARTRIATQDEIDRLIHSSGYIKENVPETIVARVMAAALFSMQTGMRCKEITQLTPAMVHLDKNIVDVGHDTKTGARQVPLSSEAKRILKQMLQLGTPTVFNLTTTQVDAHWRKLTKKAMIDNLTFHDCKHYAVTWMAKKLNVFDLARVVGTKDLKVLQIYYNKSASEIAKDLN